MHTHSTRHGVLMQASAKCGGVRVLHAPGEPNMPPGFGVLNAPGEPDMPPGFGGLNAPGENDMPPGFGPVLSASTRKGQGPVRMPNLHEAFGDR